MTDHLANLNISSLLYGDAQDSAYVSGQILAGLLSVDYNNVFTLCY